MLEDLDDVLAVELTTTSIVIVTTYTIIIMFVLNSLKVCLKKVFDTFVAGSNCALDNNFRSTKSHHSRQVCNSINSFNRLLALSFETLYDTNIWRGPKSKQTRQRTRSSVHIAYTWLSLHNLSGKGGISWKWLQQETNTFCNTSWQQKENIVWFLLLIDLLFTFPEFVHLTWCTPWPNNYTPSIYILLVYVGLPANSELSHVQFRNKIARYSSLSYLTLTARE